MIAVDTNVLVNAHRADAEQHGMARQVIEGLCAAADVWAIPWPCIHEFIAVVTAPRAFRPPSTMAEAIRQVSLWFEAPNLVALSEGEGYWGNLERLLSDGRIFGGGVHDARIAALCLYHGVTELLTADRDFARFPRLRTRNPLAG